MQQPTEIREEETYWLRSRDVSDSPNIGGDGYFSKHDVTRPEDVTADDLPSTDDVAVQEIDREALEQNKTIGKWQLTGSEAEINTLWPELVEDATEERIWAAKAMTETGYEELPYDEYMIVVYTPNYFETHDVFRIRDHLQDEYGITKELYYKPDIYTAKGIVSETVDEFELSEPARFVE